MAEHVRNDVKFGTAVSHFFCVFFKTVLQITAKRVMCLNKSITKQFMLAKKITVVRLCTYFVLLRHTCLLFSKCLSDV